MTAFGLTKSSIATKMGGLQKEKEIRLKESEVDVNLRIDDIH